MEGADHIASTLKRGGGGAVWELLIFITEMWRNFCLWAYEVGTLGYSADGIGSLGGSFYREVPWSSG